MYSIGFNEQSSLVECGYEAAQSVKLCLLTSIAHEIEWY